MIYSIPILATCFFIPLLTIHALPLAPCLAKRADDTVNDMSDTISGSGSCAKVAAIFARGTFDSGNIGVWVGPDFLNNLPSDWAKQGVDSEAYQATLDEYVSQGGSDNGSSSLIDTVKKYVSKCPAAKIVVSGWSQGALVAHKAVSGMDSDTLSHISGLVTFGDPWHLWSSSASDNSPTSLAAPLPSNSFKGECITGTDLDPLCASLPSDFKFPTSVDDVVGPFKKLPDIVSGAQQISAAAKLVVDFPKQLADSWDGFTSNLKPDEFVRLLLTPQHFTYGNNGNAKDAASWVSDLLK